MNNKKKTLLMSLGAMLLVAATVVGTMAFLTSTTGKVVNTFTVGKVAITLDETIVDEYGQATTDPAKRSNAGFNYKLIPGQKYIKDPIVHVVEGSEPSYVYVKVENDLITDLKDQLSDGTSSIETQIESNGWVSLGENIYRYKDIIGKRGELTKATDLTVFETFTLNDDAKIEDFGTKTIKITAFAIQSDNIVLNEADTEAKTTLNK